jgi:uncharacterized membrane protein YhaH (DUF805 family)
MKTLLEYPWLCALGVGFPILAFVARFRWRAAQHSVWLRLLIALIFACAVTPIPFSVNNGHSPSPTSVVPAVMLLVAGISGLPDSFAFGLFVGGLIPIGIVKGSVL